MKSKARKISAMPVITSALIFVIADLFTSSLRKKVCIYGGNILDTL